jgi:transposase
MYLKTHRRKKDGKEHVYYSLTESIRVSKNRVVQRRVLNLGELNTTQVEAWQRTIEVIQEDGARHQMRLFSDREGQAPAEEDVAEVRLSTLEVHRPRRFGDCWVGNRMWEELGLDRFWEEALGSRRGDVSWEKVLRVLVINRLCDPGSEWFVHQRWYSQSALPFVLDADARLASKDRLYRCLDKLLEHKEALQVHLTERWGELFGAGMDVLLYDLTSTYFEGPAAAVEKAQRGYSRDHRPDCLQVVLALVVTPEGFPLSYEVFGGNRQDVTTLEEMLDAVEKKYGKESRIWVCDRGLVSDENLALFEQRNCRYLVGTPRRKLADFEAQLLAGDWHEIREELHVQYIQEGSVRYVLARSRQRAEKERAMRRREIRGLMRDLVKLARRVRLGQLKDPGKIHQQIGRLRERYPVGRRYVSIHFDEAACRLERTWDKEKLRLAEARDGAYLLRTNLDQTDPEELWRMYVQLTEAESAFRALKSELGLRPIYHRIPRRVEAHILVAFLGYSLWVCLKHRVKAKATGLTPRQVLEELGSLTLVEVSFQLSRGGKIWLPRITVPEPAQQALLQMLGWKLPAQPPPRITQSQAAGCVADLER